MSHDTPINAISTSGDDLGPEPSRVSPGVLARRFIGILLEESASGNGSSSNGRRAVPKSSFEFDELDPPPLVDDEVQPGPPVLAVDVATAAVLLAGCFEEQPSTLKKLRREAPVVVMRLPSEGIREAVEHVLESCVFGRGTKILEGGRTGRLRSKVGDRTRRSAVVLNCDVSKPERFALQQDAIAALSLAVPICALIQDAGSVLPDSISKATDHVLRPAKWNANAVAILIEAVTGEAIDVPDEEWIARLSEDDLAMSVSLARGAATSLDRLRTVAMRRSASTDVLPSLGDLAGYGKARDIGLAMIADAHAYRDGRIGWKEVDHGMLLAGAPGTGKTFFARCFARTANLPLVVASLAHWQSAGSGHLGDCLSAMKRSFSEAKAQAPSVLFIDELDSIGDRAGFDIRHRDYSTQVVNSLLEELDGAADRAGVLVLAATNLVDRIDPAILRSGRLDRIVHIDLPQPEDLVGILRTCLGELLPGTDLMAAALAGRGGSGADVAAWVRRARGVARREDRALTMDDLMAAVRDDRPAIPPDVRTRVAMHEAGHAVAALALGIGEVHALALHDGGGTATMLPTGGPMTRDRAIREIVHALAGRAAETIATGSPSAGAGGPETSDLALATRIALSVEASWGLGESGPLWLGDGAVTAFGMVAPVCLPAARRLLLHAEAEAERIVRENLVAVRRCADLLLSAGYLDADRVISALGPIAPATIAEHRFHDPIEASPTGDLGR